MLDCIGSLTQSSRVQNKGEEMGQATLEAIGLVLAVVLAIGLVVVWQGGQKVAIEDVQPSWGWYIDPKDPEGKLTTAIWFVSNRADLSKRNAPRELFVAPPAPGAEESLTRITIDTFDDRQPAVSPDGSRVAYVSNKHGQAQGNVYLYDILKGTHTRVTYRPQGLDSMPAWSPLKDGQGQHSELIIVSDLYSKIPQLYRVNIPTGTWTQITYSQYPISSPHVSPDGRYIAYTMDVNGNTDIYVMDYDGRNVQRITSHPKQDQNPKWCPKWDTGYWIAFESDRTGDWNVYLINPFTKEERPVTQHPGADFAPAWSPAPDGKSLVFVSDRDAAKSPGYRYSIYLVPDVWGTIQPTTGEVETFRVTGRVQ